MKTQQLDEIWLDVLGRLLDSAKGYEEAAGSIDENWYARKFRSRASIRREFIEALVVLLQQEGMEISSPPQLWQIDRRFPALCAKIDFDHQALAEEVSRCEVWLLRAYDCALEPARAWPQIFQLIENQRKVIRLDIDIAH